MLCLVERQTELVEWFKCILKISSFKDKEASSSTHISNVVQHLSLVNTAMCAPDRDVDLVTIDLPHPTHNTHIY